MATTNNTPKTSDEIKNAINLKVNSILNKQPNGVSVPFVCIICDTFVKPNKVVQLSESTLKKAKGLLTPPKSPSSWNYMTPLQKEAYQYNGYGVKPWMKDMMLSPRGSYYKAQARQSDGFAACQTCKQSLESSSLPLLAILNNMAFGTPPSCLLELNDAELAFLSPVKTYGYCFSYSGGKQRTLKEL